MRLRRPYRLAVTAQLLATAAVAGLAAWLAGTTAFASACLGGGVGIAGLLAFALFSRRSAGTAADTVRTALRAEAVKIITVVLLLWASFAAFPGLSVPAYFLAFILSILLSGIAFAVSGE